MNTARFVGKSYLEKDFTHLSVDSSAMVDDIVKQFTYIREQERASVL